MLIKLGKFIEKRRGVSIILFYNNDARETACRNITDGDDETIVLLLKNKTDTTYNKKKSL